MTRSVPPQAPVAPRGKHPIPDWSKLRRDDHVTVLRTDGQTVAGRIDMIAIDRTLFWLFQDRGLGRVLVTRSETRSVAVSAPRNQP
ncbi:hypothetical protein [Paenarthrobacter sp. NPDC058040]|uniref:hypothetical protein n=1 Tax=unclassified Paenarthrobacter TaxID=2634190 RepID=UPI0036D9498E